MAIDCTMRVLCQLWIVTVQLLLRRGVHIQATARAKAPGEAPHRALDRLPVRIGVCLERAGISQGAATANGDVEHPRVKLVELLPAGLSWLERYAGRLGVAAKPLEHERTTIGAR